MNNILELAASVGGIGGLLAMALIFVYRKTVDQMRDDRKFMEDRLTRIIKADQTTRTKHTKVLTELITYLKIKNGNK